MFIFFPLPEKKFYISRDKVNLRKYNIQIRKFIFMNFSVKGKNAYADSIFCVTKSSCLWYTIKGFFRLFFF
jgi:hypothetical protein